MTDTQVVTAQTWPEHYPCPECGTPITRPRGAQAWDCPFPSCSFLDAVRCYRCETREGFPRRKVPVYDPAIVIPEMNVKRHVYCERCFHEMHLDYTQPPGIRCLLCPASGLRGATLTHVLGEEG